MLKLLLSVFLTCFTLNAMATCEELKAKIEAKLKSKGVKYYSLEIRPIINNIENSTEADKEQPKVKSSKVIGTCEDDSKEILYTKL